MKTKIILFLTLSVICVDMLAQQPAWTDYYKRQEMYPESEFLVGFMSGVNNLNADPGDLKQQYEMLAKDKLVQSIQVEIESNNSLNISNVNGKSDEEFLSKSVSFSSANVNGLKASSYYDRKKKEVFAIAFVNKKELAYYYRNIISSGKTDIKQKLAEGRKYAEKSDKENALRSFYEAMPVLKNIDEARVLLIALNRKMYSDIDIKEVNALKVELITEIDNLVKPEELSFSEISYFAAYGIFLQLADNDRGFYLSDVSFENTGLLSKFSEKWNTEFSAALVKAGKYKISERKSWNSLVVNGNYWKEGKFLKLNISVWDGDKIIAVSKASMLVSVLENQGIDFIPPQIDKMKSLSNYKMKMIDKPEMIKISMPTKKPVIVKVININEDNIPVHGLPVLIYNLETGEILSSSKTSEDGIAECYLPAIETTTNNLSLNISLDIESYFNVGANSVYFGIAKVQNPLKEVVLNINVNKPTIYVESIEKNYGKDMGVKTLEAVLKESFSAKSYSFVDRPELADLIVKINANTTTGTSYQGIMFAYLDANISVIDVASGEELTKTHFDQIKGGGANKDKAAKKAYFIASEKLKVYINTNF